MDKLGIIAGNGKFPLILAENAARRGVTVVAVALSEETEKSIENVASKVHWLSITQLGGLIKAFKADGVTKAVMAGQVVKRRMYTSDLLKLDLTAARLWASLPDRRGDTILRAVADELAKNGIELLDSTTFMEDYLAVHGVMTKRRPSKEEQADVEFGFRMAKVIAEYDIGQSVVVKGLSVVAVEAVEGTDNCIRRAGELGKGGIVVVKVSRKGHDMRFDVPVVGMRTLDTLKESGAKVLAVEAGKTLMLEKDEFLAGADAAGICVVGV
ncbi:MAG: UDP-2,3-diacylglucosamine diphosphatase LpxI [Nitrospirae bacterium]|nr:UDP-2,3-diacylglucosamine diphosphatase LpxI [Nitrospirota bacterium]MBI5694811.1 UDP-2,3-diacylglucosamine diphosphatase LpxI [Nitrospirota bacterium]